MILTSWHNVKSAPFNAVGDGIHDDTVAIQAAINWTASDQRGTIYFPPGSYKVTAPLVIYFGTGANQSIILRGDGDASRVIGNVSGYIIDRYDPTWSTPSGIIVIEKLFVVNTLEAAGAGAIRLGNCNGSTVRDCKISGMNGLTLNQAEDDPTFLSNNCSAINCTFPSTGTRTADSTAITTGNGTVIINFDCSAYDCAMRLCGAGCSVVGGRAEVNNYTIIFGVNQAGTASPALGFSVGGITQESFHATGFDLVNANGGVLYLTGGTTFVGTASYGLRLRSGVNNIIVEGFNISGSFSVAAISIEDSTGTPGSGNTFIGATTPFTWAMPTKAKTAKFINSNNPAPIFLFVNLPSGSDVVFGDEYVISNSNVAVSAANFGATVAGGGAITAKVRWNGSNWILV